MEFGKSFIPRAALLTSLLIVGVGITACGKGREEEKADQYPAVQQEEPVKSEPIAPSGAMGSDQPPPPETAPSTATEPVSDAEQPSGEETPPK